MQCSQCLLGPGKSQISPLYLPDVSLDDSKVFLDTRDTVKQKLKNRPETTLSYAALSYAWGTAQQPHATTKTNLAAHLQGILISALPRTIRDAITLGRNLGLDFLWVDSGRTTQYPEPRDWGFIAVSYSRRQMTFESDKLPAVSSIAELFSAWTGEPYLAGLWPGALGQLLCWFPFGNGRDSETIRPAKWRAPSWSFFSVNGPIGFLSLDGTKTISERQNLGWGYRGWEITPVSPDALFGEVADAKLHLRGRLISVSVGAKMGGDFHFALDVDLGEDETALEASEIEWRISFDAMEPTPAAGETHTASCYGKVSVTEQLWWFVMWSAQESTNQTRPEDPGYEYRERFWGIAVARLPDGNYHRVGCIIVVEKTGKSLGARLQSLPLQDFTLV